MLPVGDDITRPRTPALAPALGAAGAAAALAALITGHGWSALAFACAGVWASAYGGSVEAVIGRALFALIAVAGASVGAIAGVASTTGDTRILAAAAAGTTTAIVAAHLLTHRGARILTLQLLPPFTGIVAVPAWAWALAWGAIVAALGAFGAFGASG